MVALKRDLVAAKEMGQEHSADKSRMAELEKQIKQLEQKGISHVIDSTRIAELEQQIVTLTDETRDKTATLVVNKVHDHLVDIEVTETFEAEAKTEHCVRLSPHPMGQVKYCIVVYQKQGGQQLADLIIHYLQALTYDEIVVVANEDGNILEATPMYNQIIAKGMHLWQCSGTRDDKGDRWTQVLTQYKNISYFLQPTDVDEYLSILSPGSDTSVVWNRPSLLHALAELPESNGKPYKTLDSKPVLQDCKIGATFRKETNFLKHQPRHCSLAGFGKPQEGCHNKVFFRGQDFVVTDLGNHFSQTKFLNKCETEGIEAGFQPTNFVLVHYQTLDFNDWLTHALRMATDAKFNRFDLDQCLEGHGDKPWHSCVIFREFVDLNFSLYGIQELYHRKQCNVEGYLDTAGVTTLSCH